jgi:hypothetical protein
MLDFNHQPKFYEQVTAVQDQSLAIERQQQVPRNYLGASRLGVACERALQYEYAGAPVDDGRDFSGRILRVFEFGHFLEKLAVRWLRLAGFELHNQKADGGQFGFSVVGGKIKGHVDGIITATPASLNLTFPMLWECKTMADKHWKACVKSGVAVTKPVYAAQMATYQDWRTIRHCSRPSTRIPRNGGSSWCHSIRRLRNACRIGRSKSFWQRKPVSYCHAVSPIPPTTNANTAVGKTVAGAVAADDLFRKT